ncbi:MAG: helix-turn-helix domain-containing protein [Planctomycetes bacterium]|nr:helix-turn-helix domain-containing protein [Planctomycetota bacterium]
MSFSIQPLPPVMTTEEVAALLRCPVASVARYVFSHELAAIQIGRERRFRAEDVLEFIAQRPLTIRAKRLPSRCGRSGHTGRR